MELDKGIKTTISSRDQVPYEGYHLHCMGHHTEHDQITVGQYRDLTPSFHNSCLNGILGSAELRDL